MNKPVIFLDFDGVLNTYRTWGNYPRDTAIDLDKVERVAKLAKECDAEIVISSAWRAVYSIAQLRESLLKRGGLDPDLVIDVTRESHVLSQRGEEICDWLKTNERQHDPFIILDDMSDIAFVGLTEHLVQTTLHDGFSEERYEYAKKCLQDQVEVTT